MAGRPTFLRTDIFLLELAREVALDERRLADAAIPHEDQLELGHLAGHCCDAAAVNSLAALLLGCGVG